MLPVFGSLLYVGTLLIVLFAIFEVVFRIYERNYELQSGKLPLLDILKDFGYQIYFLFTSVGFTLVAALFAFFNHLYSNWQIYTFVGLSALTANIFTNYGSDAQQMFDKTYTKEGVKFNREIILPVLDLVRVSYDAAICWANLVSGRFRISVSVLATIFVNCTELVWHQIILDVLNAITVTLQVLFNFIAGGLTGTLETHLITEAITNITVDIKPALDCLCYDLDFAFVIVVSALNDTNLHYAIESIINAALDLARIPIRILISLFQFEDIFACPSPQEPNITICYSVRPPQFAQVALEGCLAFQFAGTWLDNLIQTIFNEFFENPDFIDLGPYVLPKVGLLLSQPLCIALDIINNILNIVFHVDLIFDQSVLYFQYIDVDTPFDHAFEFTTVGIPNFFGGFQTEYMVDIGCAIGGYLNATFLIAEFITKVAVKFASTPLNGEFITTILDYISSYNLDPIQTSVDNATICVDNLMSMIDLPLGEIFTYFFKALGGVLKLIISMITNIGPNFGDFLASDVVPQADTIIEYTEIMCVGFGNFFRQFTLSGSCTLLPAVLSSAFTPFVPADDPFCCYGGLTQAVLVAILEIIKIILDSVQYLVTNGADFKGLLNNVLNLEFTIITCIRKCS